MKHFREEFNTFPNLSRGELKNLKSVEVSIVTKVSKATLCLCL